MVYYLELMEIVYAQREKEEWIMASFKLRTIKAVAHD
jgi:hypothetical protein